MAFCNVDSPSKFIDIAVPCNNKSPQSIGLMWWFLAREVLRLRGSISRDMPWEVMPDLFFYRDPEEAEKEEAARAEEVMDGKQADFMAPPAKVRSSPALPRLSPTGPPTPRLAPLHLLLLLLHLPSR